MVDTIDMKWFGGRPSEPDDYLRSREAYDRLCRLIRGNASSSSDADEGQV